MWHLQMYNSRRFTAGNFQHYELYFTDGSCPSEAILQQFLSIVESEPGASLYKSATLTVHWAFVQESSASIKCTPKGITHIQGRWRYTAKRASAGRVSLYAPTS